MFSCRENRPLYVVLLHGAKAVARGSVAIRKDRRKWSFAKKKRR